MHELFRLGQIPGGSLEGAIEISSRLYWRLRIEEIGAYWCVFAGEDIMLRADSRVVAEAFIYGLGLAYSVLPDDIFAQLEDNVRRLVE